MFVAPARISTAGNYPISIFPSVIDPKSLSLWKSGRFQKISRIQRSRKAWRIRSVKRTPIRWVLRE